MPDRYENGKNPEKGSFGKRFLLANLITLTCLAGYYAVLSAVGMAGLIKTQSGFIVLLIPYFFMMLGILLIGYGRNMKKRLNEAQDHLRTITGRVSDITYRTVYRNGKDRAKRIVWVSYSYNGTSYDRVHYYNPPSSVCVGDYLEVTIDPRQPERIANQSGTGLVLFMGVLFVLMPIPLCISVLYLINML